MQVRLILQLLVLLGVANGAPLMLHSFLGRRWAYPLDFGASFVDGRRLLGSSKTIRGILASLLATAAAADIVGLGWKTGLVIASAAMAGDLFSSFIKRRLRLAAGDQATGLDQIPESLFPLLACQNMLSLTPLEIVVMVAIFFFGEILLSILFFHIRLRERPY